MFGSGEETESGLITGAFDPGDEVGDGVAGLASKIGGDVAEGVGFKTLIGVRIGYLRGVEEAVGFGPAAFGGGFWVMGNPVGCVGEGVGFGPNLFGGWLCPGAPAPALSG